MYVLKATAETLMQDVIKTIWKKSLLYLVKLEHEDFYSFLPIEGKQKKIKTITFIPT